MLRSATDSRCVSALRGGRCSGNSRSRPHSPNVANWSAARRARTIRCCVRWRAERNMRSPTVGGRSDGKIAVLLRVSSTRRDSSHTARGVQSARQFRATPDLGASRSLRHAWRWYSASVVSTSTRAQAPRGGMERRCSARISSARRSRPMPSRGARHPRRGLTAGGPWASARGRLPTQAVEPSDVQMSIFVRTRAMTSSVKSDVVAEPPRSSVFTPLAVVSSTDS